MTLFNPLSPCTAQYVPDSTSSSFLVQVWGKCDDDYDLAEPVYVLMNISVSTPEDSVYHSKHGDFFDRNPVPYEGDHCPETTVDDVHAWCVQNDIYYEPEIDKNLAVPTMILAMNASQFLIFTLRFSLSKNPLDGWSF